CGHKGESWAGTARDHLVVQNAHHAASDMRKPEWEYGVHQAGEASQHQQRCIAHGLAHVLPVGLSNRERMLRKRIGYRQDALPCSSVRFNGSDCERDAGEGVCVVSPKPACRYPKCWMCTA